MEFSMCCTVDASGEWCLMICPIGTRCTRISAIGSAMAPGSASRPTCGNRYGCRWVEKLSPRLAASTAKASKPVPSGETSEALMRGKKIRGRKRHLLVDSQGLLVAVKVHSAAVQDRDGAKRLLEPLV